MRLTLITALTPRLISMSTVKIARIRLPGKPDNPGMDSLGKPAMDTHNGIIYLPDRSNGTIMRIDTEDDRVLPSIDGVGDISAITICQERELAFLVRAGERVVQTYKSGLEESFYSLEFSFQPRSIAFDGDRDLLLVLGQPSETGAAELSFHQFPDCRELAKLSTPGNAISAIYDDLEDAFRILENDPGVVVTVNPKDGLGVKHVHPVDNEEATSFDVCPTEKRIVVGTRSGKIFYLDTEKETSTVLASFREPVSSIIYNPLVGHLYVTFAGSRNFAVFDMETHRLRELLKCGSEVSRMVFDELHNKIYLFTPENWSAEVYLDQGR